MKLIHQTCVKGGSHTEDDKKTNQLPAMVQVKENEQKSTDKKIEVI